MSITLHTITQSASGPIHLVVGGFPFATSGGFGCSGGLAGLDACSALGIGSIERSGRVSGCGRTRCEIWHSRPACWADAHRDRIARRRCGRAALESLQEHHYRIEDIVLMGGMASRRGWEPLAERFAGRLINLYSTRDSILSIAPVWDRVVGTGEVQRAFDQLTTGDRVINHNITRVLAHPINALAHHSGYWRHFSRYLGRDVRP